MEILCPHCNHKQQTKSNLKKITCSSCQKKIPRQDLNNINPIPTHKKKGVTSNKVKLD